MPKSHRPSVRGKRYVVSSLHYLATMAGVRILESGGNAADAGVATGICINVLQPQSACFGGVAPIIYWGMGEEYRFSQSVFVVEFCGYR